MTRKPEDWAERYRRIVRCGGCGGKLGQVLNLMQLDLQATWDYPCACNVITGENHQAVAILCDACIEAHVQPREAVEIDGEVVRYHAVGDLRRTELTPEQAQRKAALEREQRAALNRR